MPATAEAQARTIGFLKPQVQQIPLRRGEKFSYQGVTAKRIQYELRYEIFGFDQNSISLKMDGQYTGGKMGVKLVKFPLVPNRPHPIPKVVDFGQPNIHIAFLAPSASQFLPKAGLYIALGEVRKTVPLPPTK